MSAHNNGSGPRSNRYSEDRFTNWSEYEPWWLEVQAIFKRFDGKIAKRPAVPKILEFECLEGFVRPCTARDVEGQLIRARPNRSKYRDSVCQTVMSGSVKPLDFRLFVQKLRL